MDPTAVEWAPTRTSRVKLASSPTQGLMYTAPSSSSIFDIGSTLQPELTPFASAIIPGQSGTTPVAPALQPKSTSTQQCLQPAAPAFVPKQSTAIPMFPPKLTAFAPEFAPRQSTVVPTGPIFQTQPKLTAFAPEFAPQQSTINLLPPPPDLCRFFLRGACRNGLACPFRHDAALAMQFAPNDGGDANQDNASKETEMIALDEGIQVEFGPGASVFKLVLGNDKADTQKHLAKSIIVTNIPRELPVSEQDMRHRLEPFGKVQRLLLDVDRNRPQCWFVMAEMADAQDAIKAATALHGTCVKTWVRNGEVRDKGSRSKALENSFVSVVQKQPSGSTSKNNAGVPVKVQWYAPSRCAWIYFHAADGAIRATREANGKQFCGRPITTSYKPQTRHIHVPYTKVITEHIVWVGNLGETATADKLRMSFERHGKGKVKSVTLGDLPFQESEASLLVRQILQKCGNVVRFDVASNLNKERQKDDLKRKALAWFETAETADFACRQFAQQKSIPELGGGKLFVQRLFSIKYPLPIPVFDALKRKMFAELDQLQGIRYHLYESSLFRTISITADEQLHIDAVKLRLGRLIEGEVVRDPKSGNAALWNRYTSSATFQKAIPACLSSMHAAVWCDRRRQQIRVFGNDRDRMATIKNVLSHCTDALTPTQAVPIAEHEFQHLVLQGRSALDMIIAETKVRQVSIDVKNRALLVEGGDMETRRIKAFVAKLVRGECVSDDGKIDSDALCPVCFCTPDSPVRVDCGHFYCRECFDAWVGSGSIRDFPLTCLADDCDKGLLLRDLQSSLDEATLNNLLRLALDCHVRANSGKLQFCITPTCPGVYVVAKDMLVSKCSTCSIEICLQCKASHTNMTCKDYRFASQPPDKLRMRVIDEILTLRCPRCQQAFFDFDGCFAIRCGVCPCSFCEFHAAQRARRTQQLKDFLEKLPVSQRETTIKALEQDLVDLNIRL
ncbi:hypothetical protein MPSEU_000158700 [Mayamaea pseudoterrestris]|nr:hypothetical protein MPSEU_000158700 [Mayamaea pseudoterrestris]